MADEWIPLPVGKGVEFSKNNLITRKGPLNTFHVALGGNPMLQYDYFHAVAYMEIKDAKEDTSGWVFTSGGGNMPAADGMYLVTLKREQGYPPTAFDLLFYEAKRKKWFSLPKNYEVIAYRAVPEPYIPKN